MRTFIKSILTIVIVGIVAFLFYNKVYIPKTTYTTITPKKGVFKEQVRAIGNVSAKDIYSITAQTGGKIIELHTDSGEWVKKGKLLIKIDGVDLPAQLAIAKANLAKAKADIKAIQSDLESQKAKKRLLNITYRRYKKLKNQNYASQSEYDKAKADLESIDASIKASLAHINSAKSAKVVAMKNIDAIKIKIDKLKVYSPIDGYVIEKNAQIAQTILPTTPIFKIVNAKTLWVDAKVDERVSSKIEVGQQATITLRSNPNKTYKGVVKRIDAMSDLVTLEREIDIGFINIPKPFYINEQAQVDIEVHTYKNATIIPAKVIVQKGENLGVWVLQNSKAHFIKLKVIAKNPDSVAVGNIDEETEILVPNSQKKPLKEGMKVHI